MTNDRTAPAPMGPGTYLRKRREAAGLTVDDVVKVIGGTAAEQATNTTLLQIFERDNFGDINCIVDRLPSIFSMDTDVYSALCLHAFDPETEAPLPLVCRICACSWNDACPNDGTGDPCSWSAKDPSICSACERLLPANDTEAGHAS